jgi:hypothetical protein
VTALEILSSLASRLPLFIVWIVALVLAVARWERHPNVSLMVVLAVGVLMLTGIVGAILPFTLMRDTSQDVATRATFLSAIYFGLTVFAAGGWGLLLAAIFGWRNASAEGSRALSSGA